MSNKQPIHIKKSHEGDFTQWCHEHGFKSVQAGASHVLRNKSHYSKHVVEMANFAHNAGGWGNHKSGLRELLGV